MQQIKMVIKQTVDKWRFVLEMVRDNNFEVAIIAAKRKCHLCILYKNCFRCPLCKSFEACVEQGSMYNEILSHIKLENKKKTKELIKEFIEKIKLVKDEM